jgi:hypothetical protein
MATDKQIEEFLEYQRTHPPKPRTWRDRLNDIKKQFGYLGDWISWTIGVIFLFIIGIAVASWHDSNKP